MTDTSIHVYHIARFFSVKHRIATKNSSEQISIIKAMLFKALAPLANWIDGDKIQIF